MEQVVYKPSKIAKYLKWAGIVLAVVGVLYLVVAIPLCGKSIRYDETYSTLKEIYVWDVALIIPFIFDAIYCWLGTLFCLAASVITEAANVYLQKHDVYEVDESVNIDPVEAYEDTL